MFLRSPTTVQLYPLSLHDALPIWRGRVHPVHYCRHGRHRHRSHRGGGRAARTHHRSRSEEHTSELQSRGQLVCRLLPEKKKSEDPPTVDGIAKLREEV